ncbi:GNAT family N-acetyltransferase [Streptomyces sp. NPDC014872]|uniref:GNAT family N-acetyltransferase n=1 Tax=Streptomyces sp. NPDC014872 TaxID=3364926 RepID=UPI0036FBC191
MDPVTLETGRLVLRAFTPADVDAVYEACQDEDIQFYTPVPVPYRRADAEKRIGEELPAGRATDKNHTLGAFRGTVAPWSVRTCLFVISPGVYELGYWAVKEQRGRGSGRRGVPCWSRPRHHPGTGLPRQEHHPDQRPTPPGGCACTESARSPPGPKRHGTPSAAERARPRSWCRAGERPIGTGPGAS